MASNFAARLEAGAQFESHLLRMFERAPSIAAVVPNGNHPHNEEGVIRPWHVSAERSRKPSERRFSVWPSDNQKSRQILETLGEKHIRTIPGMKCEGWYIDQDPSTWSEPLLHREVGRALDSKLQPGDHVVFPALARSAKNPKDLVHILKRWTERGVVVHLADVGVEIGTFGEDLATRLLLLLTAWSGEIVGQRTRVTAAELRATGRPRNGHAGLGFKWIGKSGNKHLEHNSEERRVMREMVRLRDESDSP